jgi:AbiV family abortive infection protein
MINLNIDDGVKRCLDNANNLLKDAKILLEKGSAGHAMLFVISSIEESSKAFILSTKSLDMKNAKKTKRSIIEHSSKLDLFVSYLVSSALEDVFEKRRRKIFHPELPDKPLNIDSFVEMAQNSKKARSDLWLYRLSALYVDLDEKTGKWTSPSEIEPSKVGSFLELAEKYLKDTEFQTRNILKSPKDMAKSYKNWLQNTMIPFAKTYLTGEIDTLYLEKVISKTTYDLFKKAT